MHDIRYARRIRTSGLFLLGGLIPFGTSQSQTNTSRPLDIVYPCNSTFANANATGFATYDPNLANATGALPPFKLAVTVAQPPNGNTNIVWAGVWGSTSGANYTNDAAMLSDACGFGVSGFTSNTVARAQHDSGDCLAAFDDSCVGAITAAAANVTQALLPASSTTSLSSVCGSIADQLTGFLRSAPECTNYFYSNNASIGETTPLTASGPGSQDIYNTSCTINDNGNEYYDLSQAGLIPSGGGLDTMYDSLVNSVFPVLLVYMPLVNATARAQASLTTVKTGLRCLRPTNIAPGSRTPNPLPAPTPVGGTSRTLSGGAIAGIVVGVVIFVLALVGAAIFFLLRRRRRRTLDEASEGHAAAPGDIPPPIMSERYEKRLMSAPLSELSEDSARKPELDGVPKNELDAVNLMERAELDGQHPLTELPATPLEGGEKK